LPNLQRFALKLKPRNPLKVLLCNTFKGFLGFGIKAKRRVAALRAATLLLAFVGENARQ
jgi:hypothetical protein